MKSSSKKQKGCDKKCKNRDRLSELPDEILVQILSFLTIRDAIGTAQLRRFGNLWTLNPTLKFFGNMDRLIYNVMKYHKNPTIDVFDLWFYNGVSQEKLMKWTNFALRKKTKVLKFQFGFLTSVIVLPPRVFHSQCLVTLELTNLVIKLPRIVYMGSLKTLKLDHIVISDKTFEVMISGCPVLQELSIKVPRGLQKLHFSAPNIQTLKLDLLVTPEVASYKRYSIDCPNLKILHVEEVLLDILEVIDVSSVREATFRTCYFFEDQDISARSVHHFEILLDKFRNAEFFQQGGKAYTVSY